MKARESQLASELFGQAQLDRIFPVCTPDASDSASFDEVLELLHLGGRSLPHSVLMMVPEAWENHDSMDPARRAFYQYHATMMEPWDGPACVTFTDGVQVGAVLDRNGLRPGRYWVTDDGLVVLSSEVGVLDIDPAKVVRKGRLQPGKMFLVDTAEHRIIEDDEIKASLAAEQPYQEWLETGEIELSDLPEREHIVHTHASVTRRQQTFGYTEEELRVILAPMARTAGEPLGSMGTDSPIAALSARPRLLFDYFTQLFAQVTNPPLDAIREELVTSLRSSLGPQGNILEPTAAAARSVTLPFPVIDNDELAKLIHINADGDMPGMKSATLAGLYRVGGGGDALAARIEEICTEVDAAIEDGARLIVLSDRHSDAEHAPIPSLLLTSAVHHHLIRTKQRTQVGLLVEAGDVREVHHVALLIGYGAAAVNPYLAMESVEDLVRAGTFIEQHRRRAGHPEPDLRARQGRPRRSCPRWASPPSRPTAAPRSSRPSAWTRPSSRRTSTEPRPRQRGQPRCRRGARRHRQAVAARRRAPPPGGDRLHRRREAPGRLGHRRDPLGRDHPDHVQGVLAAKDAAELAGLSEQETTEKMMEAATNG
ncbi:hypothetical protein SMICM17S_01704 [Streptomyces microflavus]